MCSTVSPSGLMAVMPPLTSVPTHTQPSPSTARLSSSWRPGRPASSWPPWPTGLRRWRPRPGRRGPTEHPAGVGLGGVEPGAVGRQADAVGRVEREDDLLAARAVGLGVVDAGAVAGAVEAHAVVGEPEAAVAVEHEVVRRAERAARRLGVERGDRRRWTRSTRWIDPPFQVGGTAPGIMRPITSSQLKQPPLLVMYMAPSGPHAAPFGPPPTLASTSRPPVGADLGERAPRDLHEDHVAVVGGHRALGEPQPARQLSGVHGRPC